MELVWSVDIMGGEWLAIVAFLWWTLFWISYHVPFTSWLDFCRFLGSGPRSSSPTEKRADSFPEQLVIKPTHQKKPEKGLGDWTNPHAKVVNLFIGNFKQEYTLVLNADCRQRVKCRLQTRAKMQNADYRLFKYISSYFHYRVLTINRIIQSNRSESLHSV